jgi:peptidoglycan hydrolase-like protein with peptidoglycan-binding domain
MAANPWTRFSGSPWVLMVGSGSLGDDMEIYKGRAGSSKEGRTLTTYARPHAVCRLRIVLDHVVRTRPRLMRRNTRGVRLIENGVDPGIFMRDAGTDVHTSYDFYFDSETANKVGTFQHHHGLAVDGIVGRGSMEKLWELGRRDRWIRMAEWQIRELMWNALWNSANYDRVDLRSSGG